MGICEFCSSLPLLWILQSFVTAGQIRQLPGLSEVLCKPYQKALALEEQKLNPLGFPSI